MFSGPGPGRPSLLTDEIKAKIIQAIMAGNFREVAVQWAGVNLRTYYSWMLKGKQDDNEPYTSFRRELLAAEKAAEIRAVQQIVKAAEDNPDHAKWWLERKFPERWGRESRTIREMQRQLAELEKVIGAQADRPTTEANSPAASQGGSGPRILPLQE